MSVNSLLYAMTDTQQNYSGNSLSSTKIGPEYVFMNYVKKSVFQSFLARFPIFLRMIRGSNESLPKFFSQKFSIDLFTTRHKVVHNDGSLNFKGLLFDKKTNYLAQILQSLSYKVCSIILPKFNTFGLFIPILGTSAIMDQTACCYNVTTSETGL